jgi:carboxyl-terminal processing protease
MPLRNLLVIFLSAAVSLACYEKAQRNRYASTLTEAMRLIDQNYVEEVDERELFENAMNGMVSGLDPYSGYYGPDSFRQVEETIDQQFGGVGLVVELDPENQRLTVMSPLVGTPAYKAGVAAGDVIVQIDGESTEGMTINDAVELMRGEPGTSVKLVVRRAGQDQPIHFRLQRAVIPVESVLGDVRRPDGSWEFFLRDHPRIGYVRVTTFGKRTTEELARTLRFEDHPVDALILDLRNNAGGLLDAAVEVCDMFIDSGRIVSTRSRSGQVKEQYDAASKTIVDKHLPMAVLVNRFSASASEIVAACLQDHRRAVIVGERTWGKGTVQNIIELEGGKSALKLTTASFWRPSGVNIHRFKDASEKDPWGVRPDDGLEVVLSDEQFQKLFAQRRARDVLRSARGPNDLRKNGGEKELGGGSSVAGALDDPQREKAVEHLESVLRRRDAPASKP